MSKLYIFLKLINYVIFQFLFLIRNYFLSFYIANIIKQPE